MLLLHGTTAFTRLLDTVTLDLVLRTVSLKCSGLVTKHFSNLLPFYLVRRNLFELPNQHHQWRPISTMQQWPPFRSSCNILSLIMMPYYNLESFLQPVNQHAATVFASPDIPTRRGQALHSIMSAWAFPCIPPRKLATPQSLIVLAHIAVRQSFAPVS